VPNWAPASSTVQGSSPLLLCSRYSNTVAHLATKRRTISLVLRRSPNDIVHEVPAVLVRPWSLHSPYLTRAPFCFSERFPSHILSIVDVYHCLITKTPSGISVQSQNE